MAVSLGWLSFWVFLPMAIQFRAVASKEATARINFTENFSVGGCLKSPSKWLIFRALRARKINFSNSLLLRVVARQFQNPW